MLLLLFVLKGRRICQPLESLEHGLIHGQQFWDGEQVLFRCRPGYRLSKSSVVRRCLKNITWTGRQPKCIVLGIYHNDCVFHKFTSCQVVTLLTILSVRDSREILTGSRG